ncbi:MAG: non-ribosomal peptide synthetase [Rhodanobacteraceae bacterium]
MLASLRAQLRAQPHAPAVLGESLSLTYAELSDSIERWVAALSAMGVSRDDLVALTAEREPATIALILAILDTGAVFLPLDTGYPPARLNAMLEDARPRLLVTSGRSSIDWLADIPRCSRDELANRGSAASKPSTDAANADLIYVLFTSGSSGRPKGVAMRRVALERLIAWHVAHPRLGQPARTLQFAPLSFDVAFQEILLTFAVGGTLILPGDAQRRDPFALLSLLARERIERIFVPYVALQALAEAIAAGGEIPRALRDVVTAGEQLLITPAIRAMFSALPGSVLHNQYGPTETHVVTAHELSGDPSVWPELPPIGMPLPHVKVKVVDAGLKTVVAGNDGELLLGGDCLAEGYLHRPELTAERFIELEGGRWYRSGDRVREMDGGAFEYLGRLDEQIKLDGYRIEPAEIEVALCRHPAVAEAAVVAGAGAQGKRLIAHIVPRDAHIDDATLAATLRAHCEAQLAPYLVPQTFVVHAALPLTASGKIDRRTLAQGVDENPVVWSDDAPLEQQLSSLWRQLLGVAVLDVDANLFDLGARSLTVVRALTELRRRGFRALSVAQIYEHPSVAKMTALLTSDSDAGAPTSDARERAQRARAAMGRFAPVGRSAR